MTPVKGTSEENQTVRFSPYKEITPTAEKGQLRSRDESCEGSRSCVVMGSGGGSRDEKSGGSELGCNNQSHTTPHHI